MGNLKWWMYVLWWEKQKKVTITNNKSDKYNEFQELAESSRNQNLWDEIKIIILNYIWREESSVRDPPSQVVLSFAR